MTAKSYPSMLESLFINHSKTASASRVLIQTLAIVAGALLVVAGSKIYIPLPFTPVPVTAQTLSVLLVGSMFGSRLAPLSILLYLMMGMVGLPVYAESASGIQYLLGPTAGYLIGFIFAAYFVGKLSEKGWDRTVVKSLPIMFLGQLLVFVPGLLWLATFVGFESVLEKGFYPFVIGGIVKMLLAGTSSALLWRCIGWVKKQVEE